MKKYSLILIIILIMTVFLAANNTNSKTAVHAEENDIQADWSTAEKISGNSTSAKGPSLASSPDGKTVLVAYSASQNPYYSYSTANGTPGTWQILKPVATSTAAESQHVNATFDSQGYAHLAWKEGSGLAYAKSKNNTNLGSGFNRTIFSLANSPQVANPAIITHNSLVHIIWAEKNTSTLNAEIFHMLSQNGGGTWPNYSQKSKISLSGLQADSPAMAVDESGDLHVAYQTQTIASQLPERIIYSKGDVYYDTLAKIYKVNWSTSSIEISHLINFTDAFDVIDPQITYANGRLDVVATLSFKGSQSKNFIYHFYCTTNCTVQSNWKTSNAISGQLLQATDNPNNISAAMVSVDSCSQVVYDGKISENINEQIRQVNCTDWGIAATLTASNIRALRPDIELQNNDRWLYVAYEKYINSSNREIYFMRTRPETNVYLPIILRN